MGLFSKLFSKKSEKTFENVKEEVLMISNQNGRIENPTKDDLKNYLNLLFEEKGGIDSNAMSIITDGIEVYMPFEDLVLLNSWN